MKIKRFVAKDMRSALEQIKLELGADAVIMSNKKVPEGVELMAAVDNHQVAAPAQSNVNAAPSQERDFAQDNFSQDKVTLQSTAATTAKNNDSIFADSLNQQQPPADSLAALLQRQVQSEPQIQSQAVAPEQPMPAERIEPTVGASIEEQFKNFTQRLEHSAQDAQVRPNQAAGITPNVNSAELSQNQDVNPVQSAEIIKMRDEMASIRQLLEHQVAGLMWQDMAQKNPNRAVLVNKLQQMGITEQLADQIAGYIANHTNEQDAWQQVKEILIQQLNTTNNDIIRHGGVVSLVGPTGVGKTTTIAKLAARFAQTHGADSVALISTDTYRIAGFEQLTTYARIIGCDVKLAQDHNELDDLIQQFANKKLVLIDTAGMGQRDLRLSQYLTTLIANARVRIRNYLVLSANTQQRVMQENVERFKKIPLAGCIYTKLDESLSFGEIISTSIQNGLAIGYLTDGQRVPEDIKVANAEKLVTLADKIATKYASDHTGMENNISTSSPACA